MANLSNLSIIANAKYNSLKDKYGGDASKWRTAGAVTLIGADIAEGYNKFANNQLKEESIAKRQDEISSRGDISLANLATQSRKVVGEQVTGYAKAGVDLKGSALNVITETIEKANDAARIKQREVDFELSQMAVEKSLAKTKAKYTTAETLISIGSSAALAYGK